MKRNFFDVSSLTHLDKQTKLIIGLTVVLIIITFVTFAFYNRTYFIVAGAFLQLFGLVAVAHGLVETRKAFGLPPNMFAEAIAKGLEILRNPRVHYLQGAMVDSADTTTAGLIISKQVEMPASAGLEEQVTFLVQALEDVNRRFQELEEGLETRAKEVQMLIDEEHVTRERSILELNQKLANLSVGGIHVEGVGLLSLNYRSNSQHRWRSTTLTLY